MPAASSLRMGDSRDCRPGLIWQHAEFGFFPGSGCAMKIRKYVHSCLLLEEQGEKILFDPGKFSFVDGRVDPEIFGDVGTVVVTHHHPDHVAPEVLRRIVSGSGARVLGNGEVAATLGEHGIAVEVVEDGARQVGPFTLEAIPAAHEPILSESLPRVTAWLINGRVLNPSDSFDARLERHAGTELLLVPVMAPYLTELGVMDFVRRMKPRQVLPVHDGYARDYFLAQRYETYRPYFRELGIVFHEPHEPGAAIDV